MPVFQTNTDEEWDGRTGALIRRDVHQVDVTEEAVTYDLATKLRQGIAGNVAARQQIAAFVARAKPATAAAQASAAYDAAVQMAQIVDKLVKQQNALLRLVGGKVLDGGTDLLLDNPDT
jgi:glucose-6-phosphate-specific signal transduction histidine kinase